MRFRSDFPLHRPELLDALRRGDALLAGAMSKDRKRFNKGDEIIRTGEPCDTIYRLESGWVARTRLLDDGRRSIIAVFIPGELFGVKSFLLTEQPDSVQSLSNAAVGRSSTTAFASSSGPSPTWHCASLSSLARTSGGCTIM